MQKYYFFLFCVLLTFSFLNVKSAPNTSQCDTVPDSLKQRNNLGLYAGKPLDLAFSLTTNRIFATVESPASLFISDDTGQTWYNAFPYDSLEYECGERGWGGRAFRVLTNSNGWVAVHTSSNLSTLTSSVINYNNGDTNSWQTAMDKFQLQAFGLQSQSVTGIGLSDYHMYSLMGKYIIRISQNKAIAFSDIIDITATIPGISQYANAHFIAIANDTSGFPFYIAVDTLAENSGEERELYKYDGLAFTKITLPSFISGIKSVFTHPSQKSGDTLFISCKDTLPGKTKIFRSYDGGNTWSDLLFNSKEFITDADYSKDWVSSMPLSNGMILISGEDNLNVSKDLGDSWQSVSGNRSTLAIHPFDTAFIASSDDSEFVISKSGLQGTYITTKNKGFEAVRVNKIVSNKNKTVFYVATHAGLAFTTEYSSTSINPIDKWSSPYGVFPININGGPQNNAVTSVAIDPNDSSHVIAGVTKGFAVTTSGAKGFTYIQPSGFDSSEQSVRDIEFVSSAIVLAVTGSDDETQSGYGNIWRTNDGGTSWTIVSPMGFKNGNTIAVGYGTSDTIIYVGTGLGTDTGYLWTSADAGLNWTKVNTGPFNADFTLNGLPINDIAVDPRGNDTIYIAAGFYTNFAWVRSTDGGQTYNYINTYGDGTFSALMINPDFPDSVYAAIRRDIFVYNAILDTAILGFRGLPDEIIPNIQKGSILVGTTTGFYGILIEPVDDITGIKQTYSSSTLNKIDVFPNPAKNEIKIYLNQNIKERDVKVSWLDIMGNEISFNYTIQSLDEGILIMRSEKLNSGLYFIKVCMDNAEVYNSKLIISN